MIKSDLALAELIEAPPVRPRATLRAMSPDLEGLRTAMLAASREYIDACRAKDAALVAFMESGAREPGQAYLDAAQEVQRRQRIYRQLVERVLEAKRQQ